MIEQGEHLDMCIEAVECFDPQAGLDEPPVCVVCTDTYTITEGHYHRTPCCDACAHQMVEALVIKVRELQAAAQERS